MSKARDNRARRRKRDRREIARLLAKSDAKVIRQMYRDTGKSPGYYAVILPRKARVEIRHGKRDVYRKGYVRVVATAKYYALIEQLTAMTDKVGNLTVEIPREVWDAVKKETP